MSALPLQPPEPMVMIDSSGHARIAGTGVKVRMLAVEYNMGRTPQEIRQAHKHLSQEQIEAALDYYRQHKAEFDAQIEEGNRFAAEMRAKTLPPVSREELKRRMKAQQPEQDQS